MNKWGATEKARPDIARLDNAVPDQTVVLVFLRLRNDLYCVEWGVKLYSLTHWEQGLVEHAGRYARQNPVCHDSTAALTVTCSFCVQSAILSALIRSPYSGGVTTAAAAEAAKTRTGRRPCPQRKLQGRRNRQRPPRQQPRTTVAKCALWGHVLASHWCTHRKRRQSWSHAVATRSRWHGFNGKGGVGGARKYDGQLLTALCGGSWTSGSRCWGVELSTLELEKSYVLYIMYCIIHRCLTWLDIVRFAHRSADSLHNHAPTEPLATS